MTRIVLPEQVILVGQPLNLERKVIEQLPKFWRCPGFHSAGFGNGRLLDSLYSLFAASMSRCSFFPGSASFFICRSQSSSSVEFNSAVSSQRSSGLSRSIAALISSTRLILAIYSVTSLRARGSGKAVQRSCELSINCSWLSGMRAQQRARSWEVMVFIR